jgi:hypothetical protein
MTDEKEAGSVVFKTAEDFRRDMQNAAAQPRSLQVGDVVVLNSAAVHPMTVIGVHASGEIRVSWLTADLYLQTCDFPTAVLRRI